MNKTAVYITLILIAGFCLRMYGIGFGLPSESHLYSYHPDEPIYLFAISNMNPSELDFNPEMFIYPTFYIYLVASGLFLASKLGLLVLTTSIDYYFVNFMELGKMFLVGRSITLLFGVMSIYVVYLIASKLYSRRVGILSALFFAILPVHIINSHYMTVDVTMMFWLLLTILFSIDIWKKGDIKYYILAGISAGLAISTKYTAGLILLTILIAHLMREKKTQKNLFFAGVLCAGAFIVTSPYVFLDFNHFWVDMTHGVSVVKDGHFGYDLNRIGSVYHPYIYQIFSALPYGMGIPLFVMALLGLIKRYRKEDMILMSFFIPYFIVSGSWRFIINHYYMPLMIILCIYASLFFFESRLMNKRFKLAILVFVIAYTTIFSISLDYGFTSDTLNDAEIWINSNIPKDSTILATLYSPPINTSKYDVINIMEEKKGVSKVIDRTYPFDLKWLEMNPDYIIITDMDYLRYYRGKPLPYNPYNKSGEYLEQLGGINFSVALLDIYRNYNPYEELRNNELNYTLIKEFDYDYFNENLYGKLDPMFEPFLASPRIEIYERG